MLTSPDDLIEEKILMKVERIATYYDIYEDRIGSKMETMVYDKPIIIKFFIYLFFIWLIVLIVIIPTMIIGIIFVIFFLPYLLAVKYKFKKYQRIKTLRNVVYSRLFGVIVQIISTFLIILVLSHLGE